MSTLLRYLQFLSLGTWLGSILYLSFVVAPGAFSTLGSRDQAGAVVGMALGRLHVLGLVAGTVFLASRVALARSLSALAAPAALAVVLMLVLTLVSQYGVAPRMAQLRAEMVSVDRTPEDHPLRLQFNRWHRVSVRLEVVVLLAGLAALFFAVRERSL
ncbi:MAG: DUF4149 domain-containing protein [Acidobacteria bacterium]|nr:DUF4149 domain-containing protein [Acidobacteriota bacterium]